MTTAEFEALKPEEAEEFAKSDPEGFRRAHGNADGEQRGCQTCPKCGDSRLWKPFHQVIYEEGLMQSDGPKPKGRVAKFHGMKSVAWLCDECWSRSTEEERLQHHEDLVAKQIGRLPSIVKRSNDAGEFHDCPKDAARHKAEAEAIHAIHDKVRSAVKGAG